jgi:hypothetical protein
MRFHLGVSRLFGHTVYKMYNTILLKILPVSGKLGFISPARSLT